jgi:AbiV family abortive infection protein
MSEKAKASIETASRLARDAELLFENSRYESAAILAVLAIEEIGKVCLQKQSSQRLATHHRAKQAAAGRIFLADLIVFELERLGFEIKECAALSAAQKDFLSEIEANPERKRAYEESVRRALAHSIRASSEHDGVGALLSGFAHDIRNAFSYGGHKNIGDSAELARQLLVAAKRLNEIASEDGS